MSIEQEFVRLINANPKDRAHQLIYADWLADEAGEDALAEGWRVLVQAERMPSCWSVRWRWLNDWLQSPPHALPSAICSRLSAWQDVVSGFWSYPDFFAAFHDAALAYVRYYHDPDYRMDSAFRPNNYYAANQIELASRREKQNKWNLLPWDPVPQPRSGLLADPLAPVLVFNPDAK